MFGLALAAKLDRCLILEPSVYRGVHTMKARLQKILSQWGIASRRQAEEMILAGRVRLNGKIVHLGQSANPECDRIEVDGVAIEPTNRPQLVYLLLNKPARVVSTCSDPLGRRTVLDLLPPHLRCQGIHPVGRLDFESTGALILTNDGTLTFGLTHPKHGIAKTYQVWVSGCPPESVLQTWRRGLMLDGRKTLQAEVRLVKRVGRAKTLLEVILREGRNRQIRRVAAQLGYPVELLHRSAIGPILLQPPSVRGTLPRSHYRHLSPLEIGFLRSQVNLTSEIKVPPYTQEQGR